MSRVHFAKRWKIIWPERLDFEGTPKLDPFWKSQPVTWQGKHGVEIRIESVNKDNSHSWVMGWKSWSQTRSTVSPTTTSRRRLRRSRMQADQRLKQNHEDLSLLAHLQELYLIRERKWSDIEPGTQSNQAYPVTKGLTAPLRHGQLPREEDGAIEFWRLKDDFQNKFEYS